MFSVRLRNFQDNIRGTYWFVPAVMTLLAGILALTMLWVDQSIPSYLLQDKWYIIHPASIAEARTMLNTTADTSLGVAGVVFSITLVPLSIISTQYGSIVLRNFLRDRGTQFVLGAYSATTFYCMFILLGLRNLSSQSPTVELSVTIAIYMLSSSLLLLVYFFHHVAHSLQASTIVEQIGRELEQLIEEDYPLKRITPSDDEHAEELMRQASLSEGKVITSTQEGYVRAIDFGHLVRIASKHRSILRIERLPGDFVSRGDPLLIAWPSTLDKHMRLSVNRAYMFGRSRTLFQDTEFGIYLIVAIAVRALSPGINDSNTPVLCLNWLGAALGMLAERLDPSPYYYDKDSQLRLICIPLSFERSVGMAFNMIREYGRSNAEVLIKMLATIKSITAHTHSDTQRSVLLKHATLIEDDSQIGLSSAYDRERVHDSYGETVRAIGLGSP